MTSAAEVERLRTALAEANQRVLCGPIAGVDSTHSTHSDWCHKWHPDCLAARVLIILDGQGGVGAVEDTP